MNAHNHISTMSRTARIFLCMMVSWQISGQGNGEQFVLGEEFGLPTREVYNICEDSLGQLYVSTDLGVYRISGDETRRFTTEDGLGSNTILRLIPDRHGRIWAMGMNDGVRYLEDERWITPPFNKALLESMKPSVYVYYVGLDHNDNLYLETVGSDDVIRRTRLDWDSIQIDTLPDPPKGSPHAVFSLLDSSNRIILSYSYLKSGSSFRSMAEKNILFRDTLPMNNGNSIFMASQRELRPRGAGKPRFIPLWMENGKLIAASNHLITRIDSAGNQCTLDEFDNIILDFKEVDGQYMAGVRGNGLNVYRYCGGNLIKTLTLFGRRTVSGVLPASDGNLWVAVTELGLVRIPRVRYKGFDVSGLPFHSARNYVRALNDTTLVGSTDSTLVIIGLKDSEDFHDLHIETIPYSIGSHWIVYQRTSWTDSSFTSKNYTIRFEGDSILSVTNWLGTDPSPELYSGIRKAIASPQHGYAVVNGYVIRSDMRGSIDTLMRRRSSDDVSDIVFNREENRLWAITADGILINRGDSLLPFTRPGIPGKMEPTRVECGPDRWTIAQLKTDGLLVFREDTAFHLNLYNVLPEVQITAFCSNRTHLIAAGSGITIVAEISAEGLGDYYYIPTEELGIRGILNMTASGNRIFMNTGSRFFYVDLSKDHLSSRPYGYHLHSVTINNDARTVEDGSVQLSRGENSMVIRLRSNMPLSDRPILWRWRLGESEESHYTTNGEINLINLKSGSYKVNVAFRDENGQWTEEVQLVSFTVRLPLIKTTWFWILMSSPILAFLAFIALSARKQRLLNRELISSNMTSLKMQINPHFIFNAFNSIQYLIRSERNNDAGEYLGRLAGLIRKVISRPDLHRISLREELNYIQEFMSIEQLRLDNAFEFRMEIPPDIAPDDLFIPPMLLQPLLENAVWHGISTNPGDGYVELSIEKGKGKLIFHIADNGIGFEPSKWESLKSGQMQTGSLGLRNVLSRLRLLSELYGKDYHLELLSAQTGTHFVLTLACD